MIRELTMTMKINSVKTNVYQLNVFSKDKKNTVLFEDTLPVKLKNILSDLQNLMEIQGKSSFLKTQDLGLLIHYKFEGFINTSIKDIMKRNGLEKLGKGVTATTWEFGKYVVRIASPSYDGGSYIPWAKEALKRWKMGQEGLFPHIHYIYTIDFGNGMQTSIVIMERLESFKKYKNFFFTDVNGFAKTFEHSLSARVKKNTLKSTFENIMEYVKSDYKGYFDFNTYRSIFNMRQKIEFNDIHSGNIMWSKKRQCFVLTDPSY